jgi:hypothetical protein
MKMIDKTIKRKLFETLRDYYNNRDFILGVGSNVTCDEDRQTVIDFINQRNKPTPEEVIILTVELNQKRYPERYVDAKN